MSDIHPFDDPERLRLLLVDVHYGGDRPWEHDPDVAELMALTARKYAGLAAKHHRDPAEAAAAAWDVMRTRAARDCRRPLGSDHACRGAAHVLRRARTRTALRH